MWNFFILAIVHFPNSIFASAETPLRRNSQATQPKNRGEVVSSLLKGTPSKKEEDGISILQGGIP